MKDKEKIMAGYLLQRRGNNQLFYREHDNIKSGAITYYNIPVECDVVDYQPWRVSNGPYSCKDAWKACKAGMTIHTLTGLVGSPKWYQGKFGVEIGSHTYYLKDDKFVSPCGYSIEHQYWSTYWPNVKHPYIEAGGIIEVYHSTLDKILVSYREAHWHYWNTTIEEWQILSPAYQGLDYASIAVNPPLSLLFDVTNNYESNAV